MGYERPNITKLSAYAPGEQPQTPKVVKLNTNENPYPPADAVMEAVRAVSAEQLRRYPPPTAVGFRRAAADAHGVTEQQVIATNGGDELLRMAVTVFCEPDGEEEGGGLGTGEPSYSLYPVLAGIHDTPVTRVELAEDFSLPDDFADRLNDAGCRLAIVVNPHAPSGRLEPIERLAAVAERFRGVLMIDEAYVDFADADALPLVREGRPNVLLLRTLSKGYSLAGLRFGYGIGHADLIAALDKARDSYNTDALAQAAATAAITHRDAAKANCRKVIDERTRLRNALIDAGFTVPESQSNFLLATPPADPPESPDAATIYHRLKDQGIFVRYFDQDRLRDKLRITIGTPQQNDTLLAAITATVLPS